MPSGQVVLQVIESHNLPYHAPKDDPDAPCFEKLVLGTEAWAAEHGVWLEE